MAALLLTVRFLLELAALGALAWWGLRTGETALTKVLLGAGAPLAMAVVWGAFVAPKAAFAPSTRRSIFTDEAGSWFLKKQPERRSPDGSKKMWPADRIWRLVR